MRGRVHIYKHHVDTMHILYNIIITWNSFAFLLKVVCIVLLSSCCVHIFVMHSPQRNDPNIHNIFFFIYYY